MTKKKEGDVDCFKLTYGDKNIGEPFFVSNLKEYSKDNLVVYNIKDNNINLLGNIINEFSKFGEKYFNISLEEFLREFINEKFNDIYKYWIECKNNLEEIHSEFKINNIYNRTSWISLKLKPLLNKDGELEVYFGYAHDITREKEIEEELQNLIEFDAVTGLPSRFYLKEAIDNYLINCEEEKLRGALFLINIDNFKFINDSFGHDDGDSLLEEIAKSLLDIVDPEDLICRYNGDEFILFKPDIYTREEVSEFANNIKNIFVEPFRINNNTIYITACIGVSLFPENGEEFAQLLKNADSALFRAKNNGKDGWEFFDTSITTELNRLHTIHKELRNAMQNEELYVVFQPKVVLNDSRVNGFEALLRWNNKELGFVSPGEFISIAESSRLIVPIGKFVLEEVFKKVKELLNEGHDNFKIAVNFSEVQLRYGSIVDDFNEFIKKYNVPPKYIEVEITESLFMKTIDANIKTLKKIKSLGASVALDDFGTGYSSLNYLTKLPIDVLKIDRSFVNDLALNEKSRFIVETIIKLSHELGINVVAEGVEDFEQVEYLRGILCDVVQGFYYSKPETFDKIKNLLGKTL